MLCSVVGELGDGQAMLPFPDVPLDPHTKKSGERAVRHLRLAVGFVDGMPWRIVA